jgi:hypothetical protein
VIFPVPLILNPLKAGPEELQCEQDQAAVNRWIELADMLNGTIRPKQQKKKGVA